MKQGFSHTPNLNQAEEYGSAKNHNFSLSKVGFQILKLITLTLECHLTFRMSKVVFIFFGSIIGPDFY